MAFIGRRGGRLGGEFTTLQKRPCIEDCGRRPGWTYDCIIAVVVDRCIVIGIWLWTWIFAGIATAGKGNLKFFKSMWTVHDSCLYIQLIDLSATERQDLIDRLDRMIKQINWTSFAGLLHLVLKVSNFWMRFRSSLLLSTIMENDGIHSKCLALFVW